MEQWEKELRERLDKELDEGLHHISESGFDCYTSKKGFIEFRVLTYKSAMMNNKKFDELNKK